VLVDRRAVKIESALDDDADREDRPQQDDAHHHHAALFVCLPQTSHVAPSFRGVAPAAWFLLARSLARSSLDSALASLAWKFFDSVSRLARGEVKFWALSLLSLRCPQRGSLRLVPRSPSG